jgi:hypothetical protein
MKQKLFVLVILAFAKGGKAKMKNILVRIVFMCFCLLIIGLITTNISYAKVNAKSIMGMWLLDEGSGDTVKDTSGNGNHGTIITSKWTDGKLGKGIEFDGTGHVEIPASKTTDDILDGFTYLLWIKPTGAQPNVNTRVIERDWHNPTIQIGTAPDFYGSIAVNADQASTNIRGGAWKIDEWSHVALTYDGDNLALYVNGEQVSEKKNIGTPDAKPHAATPPANQGSIWLGSWKAAGWNYIGVVDEVGVFNVALSVDDIKEVMNNGLQKTAAVSSFDKMAVTWGDIKK